MNLKYIKKFTITYEKYQFQPQRIQHAVKLGSLAPIYTNLLNIPLFHCQTCIIHRMLDILELGHI